MARIEINTNGMVPLAIPSSGTVTANERAKIQGVETGAQVNVLNDVNLIYPSGAAVQKSFASKVQNFTMRLATAALDGIMSAAQAADLAQLRIDMDALRPRVTVLENNVSALTQMVFYQINETTRVALGGEVAIGNTGWGAILSLGPGRVVTGYEVVGAVTFRNGAAVGTDGVGYFRVTVPRSGAVLAAGQVQVHGGQRATIGIAFGMPDQLLNVDTLQLEAVSSLPGGQMVVTHIGGSPAGGMPNATSLTLIAAR